MASKCIFLYWVFGRQDVGKMWPYVVCICELGVGWAAYQERGPTVLSNVFIFQATVFIILTFTKLFTG